MNHNYLEFEARDKLRHLRDEGMQSQAYNRSHGRPRRTPTSLARLALAGLSLFALLLIWAR